MKKLLLVFPLVMIITCVLAGSTSASERGTPPACASDLMYETFELGAGGFLRLQRIARH